MTLFGSFREEAMEALVDCIGEIVYVTYITTGMPLLAAGKMAHVSQFNFVVIKELKIVKDNLSIIVDVSNFKIPFIGNGVAIQKINNIECDEIVYDNFLIRNDYNLTDPKLVSELRGIIFGNSKSG
ncbi:MAG: hypothetical protein KAS78_03720 [Candidatus Pacebacteria bacterium]|nr:hypothetical protein [Candidatus Paceibacterota bacterium]